MNELTKLGLQAITGLAFEITTKGDYHVFVKYSGHTQHVHVYVYPASTVYTNNETRDQIIDMECYIDLPEYSYLFEDMFTLDEIITALEELKAAVPAEEAA